MSERKKILLVSSAFYPEISPRSYRATELAIEFCRQGHTVVVVTKYREYNQSDFLIEQNINIEMWRKSRFPKVPAFKTKPLSILSRILSRILLILFEYPAIEEMFLVKNKLKLKNGYDLMISFAVPYPVHWGVAWSRSEKRRIAEKWIADCGDPYMGDVLDSFRKFFYFRYLEKWFCKKADFITIPIESALSGYYPEFHKKIKIIPQGFDFNLDNNENKQPVNDLPTFAYAGVFLTSTRNPKPLMLYLISLSIPFRFLVYTNNRDMLSEYKAKLNEKLLIYDYIPRRELMKVFTEMDFLINFDNNTTKNSPSKLIDYAIAKRPVLNISQDFKADDVLAFLNGDYSKRMLLPDPEQYHIKNIATLFLDLL